jgi:hypothetical protein
MIIGGVVLPACDNQSDQKKDEPGPDTTQAGTPRKPAYYGFEVMTRMLGIWNGSLRTGTSLGNFPEWVVDFRPIDRAMVMGKSELDPQNDIFLGIWPAKYGRDTVMVFRNGGQFAGMDRISYTLLDTVFTRNGRTTFRFQDVVEGTNRIKADFTFVQDSLYLLVYTNNRFHFEWSAKKRADASQQAQQAVGFARQVVVKDLSTAFAGRNSSTFYNRSEDPYPATAHPYLGNLNLTIGFSPQASPTPTDNILVVLSTQKLIQGFVPSLTNFGARSRYVVLKRPTGSGNVSYSFTYFHPGTYFLNVVVDKNGNQTIDPGDHIMSTFDKPVTVNQAQVATADALVDFRL